MDSNKLRCAIIAGGKSGRFGSDKSLYSYEGKTLIQHVFSAISPVFNDVVIIANDSGKFSFLGLPVIPDIIPGLGPIGGIYTAVQKLESERIFIFPCDMPFLNTEFIRYMTEIPDIYDIVVPEISGYYQPLHAIYSKNCITAIRRNIDAGDYRMSGFFEGYNIRAVGEDEIGFYDDPEKMFRNVNFREDIEGDIH